MKVKPGFADKLPDTLDGYREKDSLLLSLIEGWVDGWQTVHFASLLDFVSHIIEHHRRKKAEFKD